VDELAVLDGGKCILQLRGVRPFLSNKYDLTRHPNYRYTADADPKNVFAEGVTEELKRTRQMEWVQRCNNIHNRAEEIVLHEMIYS